MNFVIIPDRVKGTRIRDFLRHHDQLLGQDVTDLTMLTINNRVIKKKKTAVIVIIIDQQ